MHPGCATVRLVTGLALALGLAAAVAPRAGALALGTEDNSLASITIYTAICPTGYTGTDYFGACYGTPGKDVPYLLTGPAFPETVTTSSGADGFAAFEGIDEAGEYLLQIDVPLDAADVVAFCSDEFGASFPVADESAIAGVGLDLTLDDDLRCDFYVIPENLSGLEPTPQPTSPTTLPNTGTGASDGTGGGSSWPLAAALGLLALAAGSFAAARLRLLRAAVPTRR
jgi:hypothetical protein